MFFWTGPPEFFLDVVRIDDGAWPLFSVQTFEIECAKLRNGNLQVRFDPPQAGNSDSALDRDRIHSGFACPEQKKAEGPKSSQVSPHHSSSADLTQPRQYALDKTSTRARCRGRESRGVLHTLLHQPCRAAPAPAPGPAALPNPAPFPIPISKKLRGAWRRLRVGARHGGCIACQSLTARVGEEQKLLLVSVAAALCP